MTCLTPRRTVTASPPPGAIEADMFQHHSPNMGLMMQELRRMCWHGLRRVSRSLAFEALAPKCAQFDKDTQVLASGQEVRAILIEALQSSPLIGSGHP